MKKKILVADDDKNIRVLYEKELTDEGYEVILAEDGDDALLKTKEYNPDIVVMDIKMPNKDGFTAMKELLEDRKISVILNTAYSHYMDNFMSWAADAYIVKSSDLTELKNKINEIIDK
jgi:DNA-binding response OmpR family regulator